VADALLEATAVRAQYGQVPVLHGIDFHIDEGEMAMLTACNAYVQSTELDLRTWLAIVSW
jgi:ABC-type branched-subunit amino acid transport system ATPase component